MTNRKPAPVDQYDQETIDNAERFSACKFRGRGRYDTTYHDTLDEARTAAAERGPNTMIYAIWKTRQALVEVSK